jgi:hypothetical protein
MNLKKGPDLKLSEIKVPAFLRDIYYDLKDRHLLPVAAILIVAIVAVPLALSQSSDPESSALSEPGTAGASTANGKSAQLVAKSAPGLRDYRRRLEQLQAKDPFVQQYTEAKTNESGTEESNGTGTESSSSSSSPSSEFPTPSAPSSPSPETEAPDEPSPDQLTYYSYAIDVQVSSGGSQGDNEDQPVVRRNLPELTMLPSRKTPALVYMGSTKDGKKALMLVSSDVKAIFGDARCVLGSERCELIAMEPGLPETVIFGGAEKTYKIELRKIHLVKTDELNRAPLGKPKKSSLHPQPHPHGSG